MKETTSRLTLDMDDLRAGRFRELMKRKVQLQLPLGVLLGIGLLQLILLALALD
jgi:hypothetical protein